MEKQKQKTTISFFSTNTKSHKRKHRLVENDGQGIKIERIFEKELQLRSPICRRESHNRRPTHSIPQQHTSRPTGRVDRLAPSVRARHQTTLRCRHGHRVLRPVQQQRPRHTHRNLHVPHRHLTTLPEDCIVIKPLQRQSSQRPSRRPLKRLPPDCRSPATIAETRFKRVRRNNPAYDRVDHDVVFIMIDSVNGRSKFFQNRFHVLKRRLYDSFPLHVRIDHDAIVDSTRNQFHRFGTEKWRRLCSSLGY
ncbi:hypothetical protein V8G54_033261 [Vigna mungo]|uniref:Uncharacterized protein n=1 Tax=Vigna mungo TaxID=3915 RepID=A0AAQ3RG67_VIGMU